MLGVLNWRAAVFGERALQMAAIAAPTFALLAGGAILGVIAVTVFLLLRRRRAAFETESAIEQFKDACPIPLRVLVAEDNRTNQASIRAMLSQLGIEPLVVSTGRDAVDAWEREEWDVILMDDNMPEMDGLRASQTIRQLEFESGRPRTPIAAVAANTLANKVELYGRFGIDTVVSKPVEVGDLVDALDDVIGL
jgi:CheY-like chemotaxis protein